MGMKSLLTSAWFPPKLYCNGDSKKISPLFDRIVTVVYLCHGQVAYTQMNQTYDLATFFRATQ